MNSLATITLNLQYPNIAAVVYAMQGDRLARSIEANLVDGSTPWTPPARTYGLITVEKPDGTIAVYDTMEDGSAAVSISGSTATLRLAEQTMTVAGAAKMNVSFFRGNGSRLSSFRIALVVAPQAVLDNVISANYISVFTATLAQIAADAAEAEQMFEQIKAAYGAPLVAATAADMTDQSHVYVYTGSEAGYTNGNWYYWNGTAWASGGVYNSTAFSTDTDLEVAGAAADAKATGDAIAAEAAARESADTALSDDVSDLKSALEQLDSTVFDSRTKKYSEIFPRNLWVSNDGKTAYLESNNNWGVLGASGIDVNEGDVFDITACQGSTDKVRIWVVTDDNYNIIAKAPDFRTSKNEKYTSRCIIPHGGTKLLVCGRTSIVEEPTIECIKYFSNFQNIMETKYSTTFVSGGLNNSHAATTNNTRIRTSAETMPKMKTGDFIEIKEPYEGRVYVSNSARYSTSVVTILTGDDFINGVIEIPPEYNGYYFGVLLRKKDHETEDISADLSFISAYVSFYSVQSICEYNKQHILSGYNLSILGDSISAFKDYIPGGNAYYYSGTNRGVFSVSQMWWNVLCKATGLNPLIINAWSGSGITQLEDSVHASITPMSDDSRCLNLHAYVPSEQGEEEAIQVTSENIESIVTSPFLPAYTPAIGDYVKKVDPDIVIIAGGINDYTYAESAQSEPLPWNGKTAPVITASFTEAYACLIKKVQAAYPKAIVVALSTFFSMRGVDNGFTLVHSVGSNEYTQADYNDSILNVTEQMHIPFVDISNIGFNRNNYYPNYASDSETTPTHPNSEGHYVIGNSIAEKIISLVNAFKNKMNIQ